LNPASTEAKRIIELTLEPDKEMKKLLIAPYNVVDGKHLPELPVEKIPAEGDPLEIDSELYFVCVNENIRSDDHSVIGVIPLVIRDPSKVKNIQEYIRCLSLAHRKVQFKNDNGNCDFEDCNEMSISK
jgi:hypothetical protein